MTIMLWHGMIMVIHIRHGMIMAWSSWNIVWYDCHVSPLSHDSYHDHAMVNMVIIITQYNGIWYQLFEKNLGKKSIFLPKKTWKTMIIPWSWYESWERGETWQSYHDHAKRLGGHAVIVTWSWSCFAMIMVRSWHDSHVFPTRASSNQINLHIINFQSVRK